MIKTPVEIDTQLAELWNERQRIQTNLASAVEWFLKDKAEFERRAETVPTPDAYIETSQGERDAATIAKYRQQLADIAELEAPLLVAYTGWNRYFLVSNTNGHVHRGMDCTTCYATTQYRWLVELADCDEAKMVAEWGEVACTVCFPDAPTFKGYGDGTSAIARAIAGAREERAAEKAKKAAAKALKNLPEPQRIADPQNGRTELITTVYGAKAWIKSAIDRRAWGYFDNSGIDSDAFIDAGIDFLRAQLAQRDIDVDPMIIRWTKAAEKEMGR